MIVNNKETGLWLGIHLMIDSRKDLLSFSPSGKTDGKTNEAIYYRKNGEHSEVFIKSAELYKQEVS